MFGVSRSARLALALLFSCCGLCAQRVLIVDASGGGDFRSIGPAVAAAAPGDHVVVRQGTYAENLEIDKGIALVGEPGALIAATTIGGNLFVRDVPAGQAFRMRGFTLRGSFPGVFPFNCVLRDTLGLCVLQELYGDLIQPSLHIERCHQVELRAIAWSDATVVDSTLAASTVVFESDNLWGLRCSGSVTLDRCVARGTTGAVPGAGIRVDNGRLTLTRTEVRAGALATYPQSAIDTLGGEVVLDPTVRLVPANGAPPVSGSGAVVMREVASLGAASNGARLEVELHGLSGSDFVILATRPAPAVLPTSFGELWLLAEDHVLVGFGSLRNSARQRVLSIPHAPVPAGYAIVLQAAQFAGGALSLSSPAVALF
ncbi:MAG: hypothetical protein R3F56_10775 [Planctomycetota bacterium]